MKSTLNWDVLIGNYIEFSLIPLKGNDIYDYAIGKRIYLLALILVISSKNVHFLV